MIHSKQHQQKVRMGEKEDTLIPAHVQNTTKKHKKYKAIVNSHTPKMTALILDAKDNEN